LDERIEFCGFDTEQGFLPLYLRIPGWCDNPQLKIRQRTDDYFNQKPSSYLVIERNWSDGDKINLTLPLKIQPKHDEKFQQPLGQSRPPDLFA